LISVGVGLGLGDGVGVGVAVGVGVGVGVGLGDCAKAGDAAATIESTSAKVNAKAAARAKPRPLLFPVCDSRNEQRMNAKFRKGSARETQKKYVFARTDLPPVRSRGQSVSAMPLRRLPPIVPLPPHAFCGDSPASWIS
jgi:hypothetical protein